MSEIKQTNFRIDQESADAFRAFCEQRGWNQAQGFDHLMQVLELQKGKEAVPERSFEISDFEAHVQALLGAYVQSVTMAQSTEDRVRQEFARRLESKDELIQSLQEDLKVATTKADAAAEVQLQLLSIQGDYAQATADLTAMQERVVYLQGQIEQVEQSKLSMERLLTGRLEAAEAKAADADALRVERDRLAAELKEQARDHEIEAERATRAAEKAQEAAVAAERDKGAAAIAELREALQAAQVDAERQMRTIERESAAEIRQLEKENAKLREQLARKGE